MLVKDVMTRTPKTVATDVSVLEVASLMCLYRFNGLPVVAEDDKLVGFIAEKDVLHQLFPKLEDLRDGMATVDLDAMMAQYKDVMKLKVSDLMTTKVITVSPDIHLLRGASVMVRNRFRRIPVADNGRLVGILSLGDVHKAIFQANLTK